MDLHNLGQTLQNTLKMKFNQKLAKKLGYSSKQQCMEIYEALVDENPDNNEYMALHIDEDIRPKMEELFDKLGLQYSYGFEEMNDSEIPNDYLKFEELSSAITAGHIYSVASSQRNKDLYNRIDDNI
jgi:hypothetical protein